MADDSVDTFCQTVCGLPPWARSAKIEYTRRIESGFEAGERGHHLTVRCLIVVCHEASDQSNSAHKQPDDCNPQEDFKSLKRKVTLVNIA